MKKEKISPLKGSCLWGLLLFGILILIDMVTKVAAEEYFSQKPIGYKIEIIPEWINLCLEYNDGMAYGMGSDAPMITKILVIAATGVLMAILSVVYFKLDKRRTLVRIAIVFIVAGGVGNLIDRVYYKVWDPNTLYGVRDMVDLSRFGFAVCNFADFFICGGAAMLVLAMLFFDMDAVFPLGKFKALAKEQEEKQVVKEAEKKAAKQAKKKNG